MVGGRKLKILPRAPTKPVPALRSHDLKLSITKLALKARFPPSLHIDLQSHASSKTHERAPSELTSDTMRDGVGGGLNAMLPDYLTSHSPVRKYYSNSTFHSHWNVLIIMSGWTGCTEVCNVYFERQVGQPIVMFGPNILIERTFYGHTPSTNDIITFRPLNLVIAVGMWRDFQSA